MLTSSRTQVSFPAGSETLRPHRVLRNLFGQLGQGVGHRPVRVPAPVLRSDDRRHLPDLHPGDAVAVGSHLVPSEPGLVGMRHRSFREPGSNPNLTLDRESVPLKLASSMRIG